VPEVLLDGHSATNLYAAVIDCDGDNLSVLLVRQSDGAYLGELENVERVDYSIESGKLAAARITVRNVRGRLMVDSDNAGIRRRPLHESRLRRWLGGFKPRSLSW
jgi:hypothetical protein